MCGLCSYVYMYIHVKCILSGIFIISPDFDDKSNYCVYSITFIFEERLPTQNTRSSSTYCELNTHIFIIFNVKTKDVFGIQSTCKI